MMTKNVGVFDRWVRIVLGVILLLLFTAEGWVKWLALIGVVLIVTGVFGVCWVYRLFHINTLDDLSKPA